MDVLGYLGPCKHTDPPGNWDAYLFVCKLYSFRVKNDYVSLSYGGGGSIYVYEQFFDKCDHV